jgi:hypothetical protein
LEASLDDFPAMVSALSSHSSEGSFIALGSEAVPDLNVQFSFENGAVGFDWVLLAPKNIEERARAESLAAGRGQELAEQSMNKVSYLRTTRGDLAGLCRAILQDLFGVSPTDRLWVEAHAVEWPPKSDHE